MEVDIDTLALGETSKCYTCTALRCYRKDVEFIPFQYGNGTNAVFGFNDGNPVKDCKNYVEALII